MTSFPQDLIQVAYHKTIIYNIYCFALFGKTLNNYLTQILTPYTSFWLNIKDHSIIVTIITFIAFYEKYLLQRKRWNILLVTRCSLPSTRCSLHFACYLLLFASWSFLCTPWSLLWARCPLPFARCSLLCVHYSLPFAFGLLMFGCYSFLSAHCSLLSPCCLLLLIVTRYFLLVTG